MTGQPQPRVGEVLRAAREARGLDLARVERDTRIRERYLDALERGEHERLPGAVYARGFVRNYAAYLGLDADTLVHRYRRELAASPPRRPARRRVARRAWAARPAFLLTPSTVTAALLTLLVGAIVAFLAYEMVTFARTPELRVADPVGDVTAHRGRSITLRGVTAPNASVSVSGLRENPTVTADSDGRFSITVELSPGSNVIVITAFDPLTRRWSPEVRRTITVAPDPAPSPAASPSPGAAESPSP